jgi:hypothetical protein
MDAEAAARLDDKDAFNLIFAPASPPRPRSPTYPVAVSAWMW